jgi:ubiquinone/menaquinone biosynthesis C-methylase UbiE
MVKHVCPWWLGYFLVSPWRRWFQDPDTILRPLIIEGMTVLDIGPGMGFFTIPAARMVGDSGKVIAVDIQEKMLNGLERRAAKAGVQHRIITRLCEPNSLNVTEPIDLCLAFNVVHEVPDALEFFLQIRAVLKPAGRLLVAEPGGWHVSEEQFQDTLKTAAAAGLKVVEEPAIRRSRSAVLAIV